ncbi:hypothetical protein PMAYCL1PPCAC_26255, partial [Pristionchus mayeri]
LRHRLKSHGCVASPNQSEFLRPNLFGVLQYHQFSFRGDADPPTFFFLEDLDFLLSPLGTNELRAEASREEVSD